MLKAGLAAAAGAVHERIKRSAGQIGDLHLADQVVLLVFGGLQQSHQRSADDEPLLLFTDADGELVECIGQRNG
jgi:hypothetical protein